LEYVRLDVFFTSLHTSQNSIFIYCSYNSVTAVKPLWQSLSHYSHLTEQSQKSYLRVAYLNKCSPYQNHGTVLWILMKSTVSCLLIFCTTIYMYIASHEVRVTLDRYKPKLNSLYNFYCRPPTQNFIEVHSEFSGTDMLTKIHDLSITSSFMYFKHVTHKINKNYEVTKSVWKIHLYPVMTRVFFSSPPRSERLWGPPSLLFNGYRGLFSGGKAAGPEADHSPPSSAKVKNTWSYTSIPPMRPHGMVLS
jgi:hypothetical protein